MSIMEKPDTLADAQGTALALSIVIPAFNEEHVIGRCLQKLRESDFPGGGVEVIVVDNGSSDRTIEVARAFEASLRLRIAQRPGERVGAVRNFGAGIASGRYLAFLDADCLVPRQWLRSALELLSQNPAAVIGAPYSIPSSSSWVAQAWYEHQGVKLGAVSYIPGGDLLIARADFAGIGGFDENLETNEDYEFCQRARAAGLGVRSFRALSVCHLGTPQTLRQFYRKQRWHGKHVFRVFFQSLPKLRNAGAVGFALYTLTCLAGFVAGAAVAMTSGNVLWLLLFGAAILSAPLALSIRSSLARRDISTALPLAVLFLAFGFARAACLVGMSAGRTKSGGR